MFRALTTDYVDMYDPIDSLTPSKDFSAPSPKILEKNEAVKAVRRLLETKALFRDLPNINDAFILRFLYARKMDVENSFQLILNFFTHRQGNPQLYENLDVDDPETQACLREGCPLVLKNRDRKGRCVIVYLFHQPHSKHSIDAIHKALALTMDYLIQDVQNQINGFVFIVDWTDFRIRDHLDMTPKKIKLIVDGFQESFPARFKGLHYVNQPWYIDGLLTLIGSFLKEKTRKKLVMHGTNLSTLHEYIPPDVLPTELGGEGEAYRADEWIEMLRKKENKSSE